MGNKINPTGLRLGITQEHRSKWFATPKTYPILLQELTVATLEIRKEQNHDKNT